MSGQAEFGLATFRQLPGLGCRGMGLGLAGLRFFLAIDQC